MSYFVYILQSLKDNKHYIGFTTNIEKRLISHNLGLNLATKCRRPFKLVYSESFGTKREALIREKQIKSYKGGEAFKKMLSI